MGLVSSNSPILHQNTQNVILEKEIDLIKELTKIMFKEEAVGIAAPQIGESKNLFLVLNLPTDEVLIFANACIGNMGEETCWMREGCLSFPGQSFNIKRPKKINSIIFDRIENDKIIEKQCSYDGIISRIIQHEYDHVEGITFDQRVQKRKWTR